mgnify:FL=1
MFTRKIQISGSGQPSFFKRVGYLLMVFIVGFVGAYDNVLNICFAELLPESEQNPLCRLIIDHYGGVNQLILIKSYLTILGVIIMISLVYTKFRVCVKIIFILSLILFFYLTFYCPQGDYSIRTLIKENTTSKSPLKVVYDFYFVNTFQENARKLTPPLRTWHK